MHDGAARDAAAARVCCRMAFVGGVDTDHSGALQELPTLAIRLTPAAHMSRGNTTRRGYGADWRKLRAWYLRRHPLCAPCRKAGRTTPATLVHHVIPHRGDDALRLDQNNLESRCFTCHTDAIGPEATGRAETYRGCGSDGTPLDPAHHWNRVVG